MLFRISTKKTSLNQDPQPDRYFIGLELPEDLAIIVDNWRRVWYPAGLESVPAHITLIAPFYLTNQPETVINYLTQPVITSQSLNIRLHGFGQFNDKHTVLFVNVEDSKCLSAVRHTLLQRCLEHGIDTLSYSRPFRPHATIANKVSPQRLHQIQQALQSQTIDRQFTAQRITLYQKRDGEYQNHRHITLDNQSNVRYHSEAD